MTARFKPGHLEHRIFNTEMKKKCDSIGGRWGQGLGGCWLDLEVECYYVKFEIYFSQSSSYLTVQCHTQDRKIFSKPGRVSFLLFVVYGLHVSSKEKV